MARRTKILIVVVILLLLLFVSLWFLLRPWFAEKQKAAEVAKTPEPIALKQTTSPTATPQKVTSEEKLKSDLSRLAASFAERFGSYSNQGEFENLLDLKALSTTKMQSWIDDLIKKNQAAQGNTASYFGVTAKAVSSKITSLNEKSGSAKVVVSVQKREASGSMTENVKVSYQNLELEFKKVSEEWKVDSTTWK